MTFDHRIDSSKDIFNSIIILLKYREVLPNNNLLYTYIYIYKQQKGKKFGCGSYNNNKI